MAEPRTLDVPERQIMVHYPDDNIVWHSRLLLLKLDGGRWIWATPDFSIQVHDVSLLRIRALAWDVAVPPEFRPCYIFDPLELGELAHLRTEARHLAGVLGVAAPAPIPGAPADALWLYGDPGCEIFGQEVASDVMGNPAKVVTKGGCGGLVKSTDSFGDTRWAFVERVLPADRSDWLDDKRSGAGRDACLNEVSRQQDGAWHVLLREAAQTMRGSPQPGWLFKGPPATKEVLNAIVATGLELPSYQNHWKMSSGVSPNSGICIEHGLLLTFLWMMVTCDQLDVLNIAAAELMPMRVLIIQRSVRRNPRSPDFEGLACFFANTLDPSGRLVTQEFDRYMSEVQTMYAQIMKQNKVTQG
jgi:hypothetical protein